MSRFGHNSLEPSYLSDFCRFCCTSPAQSAVSIFLQYNNNNSSSSDSNYKKSRSKRALGSGQAHAWNQSETKAT